VTPGATRARHPRRFALLGVVGLTALSGCTTLGGNVRGSFSCAAPDGICAPSATIDDRALAMITDEAGPDPVAAPARGDGKRVRGADARASRLTPVRAAPADLSRTQEKVLRIVFQPYIDGRGRLHEASAVRAVVARGDWQDGFPATASAKPELGASSPPGVPGAGDAPSLAAAVDYVDPPLEAGPRVDPNLPDPAVVAAARARGAQSATAAKAGGTARSDAAAPTKPAASLPAKGTPGPAAESVAAPKSDPPRATGTASPQANGGARGSAGVGASAAAAPPAPTKAMKAGSFPAGVPEGD